jgi:glycosyltransferase involved in cell wall biosynthesis
MTLWNGIDLERFAFAGFSPGGPLVTVARLSPEKGLDTLLHAMAEAVRAEPGIHLEIAGDGPLRSELEQLAKNLGLDRHVRFLGEVRDIAALLSRASLFVLPSNSEGISLTLLEAMARGLPIVTTKVGGNVEVVIHGETGLLVPPASPPALAGAILKILGDSSKSQLMGRAGRRRVEAFFDIRQVVAQYEKLYLGSDLGGRMNHGDTGSQGKQSEIKRYDENRTERKTQTVG